MLKQKPNQSRPKTECQHSVLTVSPEKRPAREHDKARLAELREYGRHIAQNHEAMQVLFDPLSLDIMDDPILASDGFVYDRSSFSSWMDHFDGQDSPYLSPMTGQPLSSSTMERPSHEILAVQEQFINLCNENLSNASDSATNDVGEFMLSSDIFRDFDRLKDMSVISSLNLKPPQIVVLGNESHGKSTLLERLIGFPIFPRDKGLCTRCPIRVQLRRSVSFHMPTIEVRYRSGEGNYKLPMEIPME